MRTRTDAPIGLLASGGLDSSILLADLLGGGRRVQPFYIRSGLVWQQCELMALRSFLRAVQSPQLAPLVVLELPLADVYGPEHWSVSGRDVPDADSPDQAVYLPGRNPLLVIKAAVWCQLNGIGELALAPLSGNPFSDATAAFFEQFESALNQATLGNVRIVRPFSTLTKRQVMELGRDNPLELTFSCLNPSNSLHCGQCNKCAERRAAFHDAELPDPTRYAVKPN